MTPHEQAIIDAHVSPVEQPISAEVHTVLVTEPHGPSPAHFSPPVEPAVVVTEEQMQRWIIDGLAGRRKPPKDPAQRAIAERLWAELDAWPRDVMVDIPASIPDA